MPAGFQKSAGKIYERVNIELAAVSAVALAAFCADTGYASSKAVNALFASVCVSFSVAFGLLVRRARLQGKKQAYFLSFLLLCVALIALMPAYYRSTQTGGLLLGLGCWLIVLFIWQTLPRRGPAVWLAFPLTAAAAYASPWLSLAFIPLVAITVVMDMFAAGKTPDKRSNRSRVTATAMLGALLAGYTAIWIALLAGSRGRGGTIFEYPNIPLRGLLMRFAELLPLFAVTAAVYIKAMGKTQSLRHCVWLVTAMLSPLMIAGCLVFTDCLDAMSAGETIGRFQQLPLVAPCVCAAAGIGFLLSALASGDTAVKAAAGEVSRYFEQRPAAFILLAAYIVKTTLTGGLWELVTKALAGERSKS